jgi:Na+/proline symporter
LFLKQIIGGMFITISMNGLDQNNMQINLSCKNLKDAQKNMLTSAFILVFVNFVFLALGALAMDYYAAHGIQKTSADQMLPNLVFHELGLIPTLFFILGLTASSFSSASSVLTAIASSIEMDLLPVHLKNKIPVRRIHALVGVVILGMIYLLYLSHTESLISVVLKYAGYTYGPILGLFSLGIFTQIKLLEKWIPVLALGSIFITAMIDNFTRTHFLGYQIGVELLPLNALIFIMLAYGTLGANFGKR